MRRVAVTGFGIVSSIGNNTQEVVASLREAKSGIVRADKYAELGFRCQVHGAPTLDPSEAIYRRAMRMGLDGLPRPDQMRLAQQLGFYEDMLRLLERQGIRRERNQTPLEFSRSLSFLPSEVYDAVRRLTRIFYRVRFGRAQVRGSQQRRLALVVARLESKR